MGISGEFIERYQNEYDKNPNSRLFAPLAEAYRKMGRLAEAEGLCKKGTQIHANFASGRLAYAKVLLDLQQIEAAHQQLKTATELSPDNILAFHLLGEVCLKLKRPREALQAFKMLLFLHPEDERAQKAVKKWEFLVAQDFAEESFEKEGGKPSLAKENPSFEAQSQPGRSLTPQRELDHAISLADALTIRNDLERALEVLIEAQMRLGQVNEIERRLKILKRRTQAYSEQTTIESSTPFESAPKPKIRKQKLELLLQRIMSRPLL